MSHFSFLHPRSLPRLSSLALFASLSCMLLNHNLLGQIALKDGVIPISPEKPNGSWKPSRHLFPGESVKLTVIVTAESDKYELADGSPKPHINPAFLWKDGGKTVNETNGDITFVFEILNPGVTLAANSVKVTATWVPKVKPKKGSGGGKAKINPSRTAEGTADAVIPIFDWFLQPRIQFADTQSEIKFIAMGSNDGASLDFTGYNVEGDTGWNIATQNTIPGLITGTVKSGSPSKGKLYVKYQGNLISTSVDEIAFSKVDLDITYPGIALELSEDRLPGGAAAPTPHEMNPGGIVLVPQGGASNQIRSKLTFSGNDNSFTEGTYILSAAPSLTKLKIYDAATGGNLVNLPQTYQPSQLTAIKTLYIDSDVFAPGAPGQTDTLTLTYQLPLLTGPNTFELKDDVTVSLLPIDIQPDANMAVVIGDIVKSTKPDIKIKHFVTPKANPPPPVGPPAPIDKPYVMKATGVTAEQITDKHANQIVEWVGGEEVPNEPLKRQVKRDATGNGATEVKIKLKLSNEVASQMNVWTVWADATPIRTGVTGFRSTLFNGPIGRTIGTTPTDIAQFNVSRAAGAVYKFMFKIEPQWIIDGINARADVPDLRGMLPPNTPVPGGNGTHPVLGPFTELGSGGTFEFGASHYWDVSRQMQITIENHNEIPKDDFEDRHFDLYNTQPAKSSVPVPFPSDPVMGNDDVGHNHPPTLIASSESNDPYISVGGELSHAVGFITSNDAPSSSISVVAGKEGYKYEERNEFREFVRLKLPSGWYRVSDYATWNFDLKVKFTGGKWIDDGCNPVPAP